VLGSGEKNMLLEDTQAGPTIQLPLDGFDAVDLAFDDTLAVPIFQRPGHCHEVPTDAQG
jgi:hypothetical protein